MRHLKKSEKPMEVKLRSKISHCTLWPEPIWIKVSGWWQIPPRHQKYIPKRTRICINWNPLIQTQIYLVKVTLSVNIVKQDFLHRKTVFENFMKWSLKGGISIDGSCPPRYILWCCGSMYHQPDTFIQIGSGDTVIDPRFPAGYAVYYIAK